MLTRETDVLTATLGEAPANASAAPPPGPLSCTIAKSFAAVQDKQEEWDQVAEQLGASIYHAFDWARVWWEHYGEGSRLRLFLFESAGRLVAIVPLYLTDLGVGPLRLRVARLVGANLPPKVFEPPVPAARSTEIWRAVLQQLFDQDACDLLSFGPFSDHYAAAEGLREAASQDSARCGATELVARDVHTVYFLPPTFEDYVNSLEGKERKTRRRKIKDLQELGPLNTDVVQDPAEVEGEFEKFARQHTEHWQSEGRPGHFHAWPRGLDYNRALVRAMAKHGRTRFFRLHVGDQVVASQYAFAFGKTVYAELPWRATGADWDRLGIGGSSQIKLIEECIGAGFTRLESGLGHYEYKIQTGGKEFGVKLIRVVRKAALSRVRVALHRQVARGLQVLLHKIWYRRIMPRLPARWRSAGQAAVQIRYDF